MKKSLFLLGCFIFNLGFALENFPVNNVDESDKEIATIYPSNEEFVVLKKIIITDKKQTSVKKQLSTSSTIDYSNVDIPKGSYDLTKALNKYIGRTINTKLLKSIQNEITTYYRKANHPVVVVLVPKQDVSLGILHIQIVEAKIGKIIVNGSKWTNKEYIRKEIRFSPNEPIDEKLLIQDIYWLNRNPFRQAYVVYAPGKTEGTTNVEVVVKDRLPFRGYLGADNIGNDITGNLRLFTGINIANIFKNQFFSYQFTTDDQLKRFLAHSGFYKIPLSWRHELLFYGGYASVDAKYHIKGNPLKFHSKGFSTQASMRYTIPLKPIRNILTEVTTGFDFKRTNDALTYGVIPVFPNGHFANLTQIMLGYKLGYYKTITTTFEIEGFWSPGKWISDQTNTNYSSIRYDAKSRYVYVRSALSVIYPIKNWAWKNYLRWQISNRNLLPSEEYGLGGFDTIRGYKEREVNVDDAIIVNSEIHLPTYKVFLRSNCKNKKQDQLDLFAFADFGYGVKNNKAPGEAKDYLLASVGPGLRYSIQPYLAARVEWGYQLNNLAASGLGGSRQKLHFSVIAGF